MLSQLITLVIYLIIAGLIFYVLYWAISQVPLPEPFNTVARVALVLIAVLIACYLLLGLIPGGGIRLGRLTQLGLSGIV